MTTNQEGLLGGYRILDLCDNRGTYCTKLLADMGAEVIKVEMPCGDMARSMPPFAGDDPHREKSLYFLYRNTNKLGITLNIETYDGRAIFRRLVKTTDVVVESRRPGYLKRLNLDYDSLVKIKPDLIMASITDFGQDGPYRDWKGSDIVDFAMSGAMISTGYPDGPPTVMPGSPGEHVTSMAAAISIVLSLFVRSTTGQGQYIDSSIHENSRLGLFPWSLATFFANSDPDGPPPPREVRWGTAMYPILPCKDGFIRIIALTKSQWEAFLRVFDHPEALCAPEWREFLHRIVNADILIETLTEPAKEFTMEELFERGNHEGVPLAPVLTTDRFVSSPQTVARKFFIPMNHPVVGEFLYPGMPYTLRNESTSVQRPAPCLGEHNKEIYCNELGFTTNDLSAFKRAGVI